MTPAPTGIDGGIFLGRDQTSGAELATGAMLARLSALGAGRAMAASFRAIWFDWHEGNAETLAAARASGGRLLPVAVINLTGYDPFAGHLARLKREGFVAAALVSTVFGWSLQDFAFKALAREAAEAGLPLQLCVRTRADVAAAAEAGGAGGTVMLRWMKGGGYVNVPDILALGREHATLMFDVGAVTQAGGIALLAERLGPERLFVASGFPLAHGEAHWFMLHAARIDATARRWIGGGSLARALGLAAPDAAPASEMFEAWRSRPKLDTHWHLSTWNLVEPRRDEAAVSEDLAAYRIGTGLFSSIRALSDDLAAGNAETRDFLDREPRARGLVVVNPRLPDASLAELDRYKDDPRFVGAKTIQDFYELTLDSPLYFPIIERLARMPGWPLMAHLPGMKEAAARHPSVAFVAAHSTWRHRELAHLPNVWFDIATSTSLAREADIADLVAAVGPDRVLFSSDAPLMDPAWTLGKLAAASLPEATIAKIMTANALKAFPRLAGRQA